MSRASQVVIAAILLLHSAAVNILAAQRPQRKPAPLPPVSMAPPDPQLRYNQAQVVRSVLLLFMGRNLARPKAVEMEASLAKKADDIDDRLSLIGYYQYNGKTSVDRLHLRSLVLWMVENHPEHPATADPSLRDLPDDPDGSDRLLGLWTRNLESRGGELSVLKNAEKFFFGRDPREAEEVIVRLGEQEPLNKEWPSELAQLYRMCGVPDYEGDPDGEPLEAYRRVLKLTNDSSARTALAGNMAESMFKAGDYRAAVELAQVDLEGTDLGAVQRANTLLGRAALRNEDVERAKRYLLDSSRAVSSASISIWGPTMVLARELLEKGERSVVLQYLQNCITIWPHGQDRLEGWILDLQSGRTPDFGNLG